MSAHGRDLHDAMGKVLAAVLPMAASTARDLARRYGGGDNPPLEVSLRRWSILQMYLAKPSGDPARCINEAHEDGCLLTAVLSNAPGLELRMDGDAFAPPSCLLSGPAAFHKADHVGAGRFVDHWFR